MPRIANIYSVPVGTDGVPDETVDANKYNIFIHDLELDLNAPRPISAGGTGASNAADAMLALGGEIANQVVTNYATFAFRSGSFVSAPGATDTPDGAGAATNYFEGLCYPAAPGMADFYLEARSLATNVKYLRRKASGVWQPWVLDQQAALDADNALDAAKVNRAGDTMTGTLIIQDGAPELRLIINGAPYIAAITSIVGPNVRWQMQLVDGTAEGGGNTGSNFKLNSFSDTGGYRDTPLAINRATGQITGNGVVPAAANDLVNKAYVDGTGATGLAGKVSKAGDTMTGDLTIADANPAIVFNKSTGGGTNLYAVTAGTLRWAFSLSNTSTESGGNAGSDYSITRYADNGSGIDTPFLINRATGNVGIGTTAPGAKLDVNGNIFISRASPELWLNKTASGQDTILRGTVNGLTRWTIDLGDAITEGGGNTGSNFDIFRYTDAGGFIGAPLSINRATGDTTMNGNLAVTGSITANGAPVGGRVLLATLTASNSATLTDTTSLTATYPTYEIVFENILPATNNDQLRLRVRSGGTFQAGAGSYVYMQYIVSTLPSNAAASGVSTFLPLSNSGAAGVGNNVSGLDGTIRLHKPTATVFKDFYGQIVHDSATQNNMITVGGSWHGSGAVIDGLEFAYVGGNIASGVIRIYGLL
jgi:hypothetical protein